MAKLYFSVEADYQKVIRLREEIAKLEKQLKGFNSHTTTDAIENLQNKLKDLRSEYNNLTRSAAKSGAEIEKSSLSMGKALAAVGGVAALKSLGSEIIRVRGEFQEMETAIETLVGKSMSDKLLPQIKELAKVSPLTMTDIVGAEKMMLGFNIEADKTIGFLKALSDVSMGSSQKFNSLTLAFSQMSAAGKLMGQDLNQMINAGFNPLQQISQTTGKSIATLKEEMSKGAVSAEMVQKAFIDATSAGGKFYKMSENASKTINGQISMMEDAWDAALNEMGQNSEGLIMSGIQATTSLIQNYETVGKILVSLVATYGVYKTALIANIALEKVQAVQRLASIKGISTLSALTGVLTKKITLLNAVMSANPWVLLATAITGVAVAMWAFSDSTTAAEKTLKNFNEQKGNLIKKEEDHKKELEELIQVLNDESATEASRAESMKKMESTYNSLFEKYVDEKGHISDLTGLWKDYNEEREKASFDDKTKIVEDLESRIEAKKWSLNLETKLNNRSAMKRISNEIKVLEEEAAKWRAEVLNDVNKQLLVEPVKSSTYKEDFQKAKKEWEESKKTLSEIEKNKEKYTTKQYEDAKKDKESKEAAYKKLGGKTDKQLKQEETEEQKKKDKEQKIADELLSIRRKNQQDEINLMQEGSEKRLRQIDLDYQKELDEIQKQERELKEKQGGNLTDEQKSAITNRGLIAEKTRAKAILEVEKELIEKYQSNAQKRLEIEKKYNKDIQELQKARVIAEERGDKIAVDNFTKSIAKATSDKGKALIAHDLEVLKESPEYIRAFEDLNNTSTETLQNLLIELERVKQAAAESYDVENLKEYTDAIKAIHDELVERNPFQGLIEAQKELIANKDKLKEYADIIEVINGGGTVLKTSRLNNEGKIENVYWTLDEALKAYNKTKDASIKSESKFFKNLDITKSQIDELSNSIKVLGDSIGGSIGGIISLIGDVSLAVTYTIDGMAKVAATGANALSAVEKASVILGIISTAIQLLNKISSLFADSFQQYQAYAEKVKEINALSDAVNQYRMALIEARHEEENWFSVNNLKNLKDYKEIQTQALEDYLEKLYQEQAIYQNQGGGGWLTTIWKPVTEFIDATLGNIYGFEINKDYQKGTTSARNNLRIETRKKSSGFLGTGIGGKSQKTENLEEWVRKNGLGELFDDNGFVNIQLAQSIIDQFGDKLVGETKETLEELIELRQQYDEYIKQLREYVSSMYEPLVDNFVDSLWAWFDEGKDALDSFKEYASDTFRDIVSDMMRTIVLEQVVGSFSDDIADIYEKYATGQLSEDELMKEVAKRTEGLIDNYEANIPALQDLMNNVNEAFKAAGIDLNEAATYSQEASKRGFGTEMTHEDAGELSGRFTALQISGEETKNQVTLLNITASEIKAIQMGVRDIATGIQDQLANSYLELVAINENTGATAKYLKDIKADISEVKENTKRL